MILLKNILNLFCKISRRIRRKKRGSEFVFDSVDLLHYNLQFKISLKRGRSNIYSPEWLKDKTVTINLKNTDDKCFQYTLTVALNYQIIKRIYKEYQIVNLLSINITGKI